MNDLFLNLYTTVEEDTLVLSTGNFSDFQFSTQLPGGFAEGSFTLPSLLFPKDDWRDRLLGKFLVVTDSGGARVYEGSIEGVQDGDNGIQVQAAGPIAAGGVKTVYLVYPTAPVDLKAAIREASALVPSWRSAFLNLTGDDQTFTSPVPLEFLHETKVQSMIETILKEHSPSSYLYQMNFAIYDYRTPTLFTALSPWYKVNSNDLSLRRGSSVTLAGTYNKLQVLYEVEGEKRFTPWYENYTSQQRYGVREGTLNAGDVPEGAAQVAGELAIARLPKPDEVENIVISGQVRRYSTNAPTPAYWLRAGHLLFVSDLAANMELRDSLWYDQEQAGFMVQRTTYSHSNASLTVELGGGTKSLEQYLADMGISSGSVA